MAIAAGIEPGETPNSVVPELFDKYFPSWFEGFAFAAIAIGALVPAAIMSIAAANLFTRNIYKEYLRRDATDAQQTRVAKITSLLVKAGAVAFIVLAPTEYAIEFQLLGGVWILQTIPAIVLGPVHALAARVGAGGRLGRGHDVRHAHGRILGLQVVGVRAEPVRRDDHRVRGRVRAGAEPGHRRRR